MKYVLEFTHKLKDFYDVFEIEKQYLEISNISTVEQIRSWEEKNNEIHIFVRCIETDKIVGELTLLPLDKKQFLNFMNGTLEDTEINSDNLLQYKEKMECYLLLSAIAIDKKYRNEREILSLILQGMYLKIHQLIKKEINILNMCSEGQTLEGQKFIENFMGMKCKNITEDKYKIYSHNSKNEFDEWLDNFKLYIDNYNQKFVNK